MKEEATEGDRSLITANGGQNGTIHHHHLLEANGVYLHGRSIGRDGDNNCDVVLKRMRENGALPVNGTTNGGTHLKPHLDKVGNNGTTNGLLHSQEQHSRIFQAYSMIASNGVPLEYSYPIVSGTSPMPNSSTSPDSLNGEDSNDKSSNKASSTSKGGKKQGNNRDRVFKCHVCDRCFGYKHVLQNHQRTHTGEKPFKCPVCHKRFTRDHHLKTHMRLHTGEKPYVCSDCKRCFVQVANLRRHIRTHTGEKPYKCLICPSCFSDSNQLKAHMLIHKGEKPFGCSKCAGRFRRRHHLNHHKCPNDEANQGKPRRGRKPKAYDEEIPGKEMYFNPNSNPSSQLNPLLASLPDHISSAFPPNINNSNSLSPNHLFQPLSSPPLPLDIRPLDIVPYKHRRKQAQTIRILTPQQKEIFLQQKDTMQTQALDMSIVPRSIDMSLVPRSSSSNSNTTFATINGVLDLSNSRSDSDAEPIEEDMEDGDMIDVVKEYSVRQINSHHRLDSYDTSEDEDELIIAENQVNGYYRNELKIERQNRRNSAEEDEDIDSS